MQSKVVLAPLTVVSFLLTGAVVASHVLTEPVQPVVVESDTLIDMAMENRSGGEVSLAAMSKASLITGVNLPVPETSSIPAIGSVPWERDELGRAFRRAGPQLSCALLETGIDVIQPLISPTTGFAGPIGRQVAFSLNLEMDPAAKAKLPRVARGAVESYLSEHMLTMEAVFYHDEQGQLFFGPQVRAAFVEIANPQKTVASEAMITSSIQELRTLGLFWDKTSTLVPTEARTLILAFRYTMDTHISGTRKSASSLDYELLFLHLLKESTPESPKLAVFATSDGRSELNLLESADPQASHQTSVIAARIRFGEFTMGMYPANPVVTGVYHQAQLSLPVDSFKALLEGFASGKPRSLSEVLDELSVRAATGDTSDIFDFSAPTDSVPEPATKTEDRPNPEADAI